MSVAHAKPPLESVLGPSAVVPSAQNRVEYQTKTPPTAESLSNPDALARDPRTLVAFLEANPDRMRVANMEPSLVMTIAQILVDSSKLFLAEKILSDGVAQWPDRPDLKRALGRILIRLGRPSAARKTLSAVVVLAPSDAESHYLLGRAAIRCEPFTDALQDEAIKAFEMTLSLNPQFTDGQVDASEIQRQLSALKRRRVLGPNAVNER